MEEIMRMTSLLRKVLLGFCAMVIVSGAQAQINNPAPYCAASYNNQYNMWNTMTVSGVTHNFGPMGGWGQFTTYQYFNNNIFPMLSPGSNASITLTPYAVNDLEPSFFALYIDFDQNNTFDPNEVVMQNSNTIMARLPSGGAPVTPITLNVPIPANAMQGVTRMRLVRGEDPQNLYGGYNPNFTLSPCNTAGQFGNSYGQGVDFDVTIGQGTPSVMVTNITVSGQNNATTITTPNGTLQMTATVTPANATNQTVTWSVVNGTGNASISNTGLLTALADGTVTVVATANDGSNVTGQQVVTISNQPPVPVTSITVNGQNNATQIATKNGTLQMFAKVLPANASNSSVTWSVTAVTGAATISNTGLLTAVGNGIVNVKATANDGSNVSGSLNITISNQANVPVPVTSITVSGQGNKTTVGSGATLQMLASVLPANATNDTVTWSVTNGTTGSATITADGLLTALTDGIVLVKAKSNDGSNVEGTKTITITNQSTSVADVFEGKVDVYPNPVNNALHLKFEEATMIKTLTVYSLTGSRVLDRTVNNNIDHYELNTAGLIPGNYFLKVVTGDGSVALLKFTKQ